MNNPLRYTDPSGYELKQVNDYHLSNMVVQTQLNHQMVQNLLTINPSVNVISDAMANNAALKISTAEPSSYTQAVAPSGKGWIGQKGIGAVPGYDETGSNSWRAANDQVFIGVVDAYNAKHGLSAGDAGFWTPQRLKAQAMIESGGHKAAFLSDPLQVNVSGDWVSKKASLLGLTKGQVMTPATSASAALDWINYKGHVHNTAGAQIRYRGVFQALRRYNGNTRVYPKHPGVQHRDWYANQVLSLESQM